MAEIKAYREDDGRFAVKFITTDKAEAECVRSFLVSREPMLPVVETLSTIGESAISSFRAALAAPTEPVTGEYVPEICTDRPDVIWWYRLGRGPKVPSDDSIVRILKRDGSEWLLKVRDVPWDDVAGWKPFGLGMLYVGVRHG